MSRNPASTLKRRHSGSLKPQYHADRGLKIVLGVERRADVAGPREQSCPAEIGEHIAQIPTQGNPRNYVVLDHAADVQSEMSCRSKALRETSAAEVLEA